MRQMNARRDVPAGSVFPNVTLTPVDPQGFNMPPLTEHVIPWAGTSGNVNESWFVYPYTIYPRITGYYEMRLQIQIANAPSTLKPMGISIWIDDVKYAETTWYDQIVSAGSSGSCNECYAIAHITAGQSVTTFFNNGHTSAQDLYTGVGGGNQFNMLLIGK